MLQLQDSTSAFFTGRDDILDRLDHVFSRRKPASSPRRDFWLWGVGGVGKTQIASRFIDLYADRYVPDAYGPVRVLRSNRSQGSTKFYGSTPRMLP